MTACSATLMLLQKVTSATVIPRAIAASRSTWSEPIPAVRASFRFFALAIRSAVRYAGQNGWEITTSASGSSRSNSESGPSLSDVTTNWWPPLFEEFAQAELTGHAAQQLAGSEVDRRRGRQGLTVGVAVQHRDAVARVYRGIAGDRVRIENKKYLGHYHSPLLLMRRMLDSI